MTERNIRTIVVLAAVMLLVSVALIGRTPGAAAAQEPISVAAGPTRTITVVGRGDVKAAPDVARVNLGVEVAAPTVAAAMDEAEQRMTAVLAALSAAGIVKKDIQTSNFSINFERRNPESMSQDNNQGLDGVYRVSNIVQVTIRDLNTVGEVIDAAVEAGANSIWGVSFGMENTDALEVQAREAAVNDALARAESLAELNGVEVGDVISISEVVGSMPSPMFSALEQSLGNGALVQPGEVTFATQIQIVYGIR